MIFETFSSYYEFSPLDDIRHSVFDISPASGNRDHEHADVEAGLDDYTANWELIGRDTERRRGSDRLYLVDDAHYVWCSRTGMERAGNSIMLSEDAPDQLEFCVVSGVFEGVAQRRFGAIKEGISKAAILDTDTLSITSPRGFVLSRELSQEEIEEYFDGLADLAVTLLSKYHDQSTVEGIQDIIKWFTDAETQLFRDAIGFEPTMESQVLPTIEDSKTWRIPNNVDPATHLIVLLEDPDALDEGLSSEYLCIDILTNEQTMNLVRSRELVGEDDQHIRSESYESESEFRESLQELFTYSQNTFEESEVE